MCVPVCVLSESICQRNYLRITFAYKILLSDDGISAADNVRFWLDRRFNSHRRRQYNYDDKIILCENILIMTETK